MGRFIESRRVGTISIWCLIRMVHLNIVMRVRSVGHFLVAFIGRLSGSLVNVIAILIRFRISISMIFLLNMNRSRTMTISISRSSRPLAISMMVSFRMVNLNLVVRVGPVHILIAITTMAVAISRFGSSFMVSSISISLNSL